MAEDFWNVAWCPLASVQRDPALAKMCSLVCRYASLAVNRVPRWSAGERGRFSSSVLYPRTQSETAPGRESQVTELLKPVGTFRQKTPQPLVAVEAFRRQLALF